MTHIFYSADVHGSETCFLKFLNARKIYKPEVMMISGDLTGKIVVPIIEQANGTFSAQFLEKNLVVRTERELEGLERDIRNVGYYPYRTNPEEANRLSVNKEELDRLFERLMFERMKRWVEMAEERLKGTNIKFYLMPGNDDPYSIDPVLEGSDCVANPEGLVLKIDGKHEMISTGFSNVTPWKCPRDIPEEELAEKIEVMASHVKDMENCIFNFHCPPYNTSLDFAPLLDEDFRPVVQLGAGVVMGPVGSTAIRSAIEKYQPLLGLHGHIHESKGSCKIGRTLCMNPGSEYSEGILRGVIVTLNKGIKGYLMISG